MKKIGLIGGTGPESTIMYYRELEYGVQKQLQKPVFPPMVIESLSVFQVLEYCAEQDYEGLTRYLLQGICNLAAAGAEYGAFTGITPHVVFDDVAAKSPIPLVSMVETAGDEAEKSQCKRVGLLGTLPTMEGDFFQRAFAKRGICTVTPHQDERLYIADKIKTELEYGQVVPATQKRMVEIAEGMITEHHLDAIVLGCTELPLIFDQVTLPVPALDVMRLHIQALIQLILREE